MFPYHPKICLPSLIGTCLNVQNYTFLKLFFGIYILHLVHLSLCLHSLHICLFFQIFNFWHNKHFFTNAFFNISWSFSKLFKHSEPIIILYSKCQILKHLLFEFLLHMCTLFFHQIHQAHKNHLNKIYYSKMFLYLYYIFF